MDEKVIESREYLMKLYKGVYEENRRLKEKINTYENPEDLTLMFMYCDEKAKDKIKQLKELKYKFFDASGDEESFTLEDYLDLSNRVINLEEIIKEVRECVNKCVIGIKFNSTPIMLIDIKEGKELLQILDKVKGE